MGKGSQQQEHGRGKRRLGDKNIRVIHGEIPEGKSLVRKKLIGTGRCDTRMYHRCKKRTLRNRNVL